MLPAPIFPSRNIPYGGFRDTKDPSDCAPGHTAGQHPPDHGDLGFNQFGAVDTTAPRKGRIGFTIFADFVPCVIKVRAKEKMTRIDAGRVIASVQHPEISRLLTVSHEPRYPLGVKTVGWLAGASSSEADRSVSLSERSAGPRPTLIIGASINFLPEVSNLLGCEDWYWSTLDSSHCAPPLRDGQARRGVCSQRRAVSQFSIYGSTS